MSTGRVIGIQHRIKQSANGEARPTQVAIFTPGKKIKTLQLKDDEAELDFVKTGLLLDDSITMVLGGSGDSFAFALSHQAEEINGGVWRVPPFILKEKRSRDKEEDAITLVELFSTEPDLFYQVRPRDRNLILLRGSLQAWIDVMKARIACEQRVLQQLIGHIFCSPDGLYPEGSIEEAFQAAKANSVILQTLLKEERARKRDLEKAAKALDIYEKIFEPITGCGPRIAAGIIVAIQDIRRFSTPAKLKKFCGVHVADNGSFVRRRHGEVANWHGDARQALYLLADQFNRRPDSFWGKKLIANKAALREKHPEIICKQCSKAKGEDVPKSPCEKNGHTSVYSNGHIHKMAMWRTLSKFVVWLHGAWWEIEKEVVAE